MPNITVLTGGPTGAAETNRDGQTYYEWSFTVNVDGQVGVVTIWAATNNPDDEPAIEQQVIEYLEENPDGLGGIAQADGTDDSLGDGPIEVAGDDDDDDSAVASSDGGDYGDSA